MSDELFVTALFASPLLDVRDAYVTASRAATRLVRRTRFVDVYDDRSGGPDRGADGVVVAVSAEEVGTIGAQELLLGACSAFDRGSGKGFGVAVIGADDAGPFERVSLALAALGVHATVEAVADADEFRDTVEGWLCAFAIGSSGRTPVPLQAADSNPGELYPFGEGL
jgi:hypothetical protein